MMNLNPSALATASAAAVAAVWTLCSLLVFVVPTLMIGMAGHMIHAPLDAFTWMLTPTGYLIGLIAWSAWAAVTGWLIAFVYNKVVSD